MSNREIELETNREILKDGIIGSYRKRQNNILTRKSKREKELARARESLIDRDGEKRKETEVKRETKREFCWYKIIPFIINYFMGLPKH